MLHNHSFVCSTCNSQLVALDHDFHIHGIVPSDTFVVDIPENVSDSFLRGSTFITNKDEVYQSSSAIRHSTEVFILATVKMVFLLQNQYLQLLVTEVPTIE